MVQFKYCTGYWIDAKGEVSYEKSVETIMVNGNKEDVYKIADELLKELNQRTILIVSDKANAVFYSGKK